MQAGDGRVPKETACLLVAVPSLMTSPAAPLLFSLLQVAQLVQVPTLWISSSRALPRL